MKNALKLIVLFFPFIVNAQYTESGCVVYLPFSGNMRDSTSNALDGSNQTGSITYGTDRLGNDNGAAIFDGNATVNLGTSSKFKPSSSFTMCIWMRAASFDVFNTAVCMRINEKTSPYNSYSIATGTSKTVGIDLTTDQAADQSIDKGDLSDQQWHHAAASYSYTSKEFRLYIDGSLVGTKSVDGNITYAGSASLVLGGISPTFPYNQRFNGRLDEFRFYDIELSAQRIAEIAEKSNAGVSSANKIPSICISPNPASQYIQIETSEQIKNIYIYDLQGKIVFQSGNTKQVFVGDLVKGLYLIKILTEEGIVNKKIVVE